MSKLFERAMSDYNAALLLERNVADDEMYLSTVCYLLQQAHEKSLKFLLELNGASYPRTHIIQELLSILEGSDIAYPIELETIADMLTGWEASSRYNDNFVATKRQIALAKESFQKLRDCILALL